MVTDSVTKYNANINTPKRNEIKWINCAKFVAIFAVITDHSEIILYDNPDVALFTYFSVSVFIFISGMMCFSSNSRHNYSYFESLKKTLQKIIPAYLITILIYELIDHNGFLDLKQYITDVAGFNISAHFYFVALYIQLMLINLPLFRILTKSTVKNCLLHETITGILILALSMYTSFFTNIFYIYGGGGKLLGGTYLFIFYLGMLAQKHNIFKHLSLKAGCVITALSLVFVFIWWRFECHDRYALDIKLHCADGVNPPGLSTFLMMCGIIVLCYSLFSTLEHTPFKQITNVVSIMGRHTLYIFLYHRMILDRFLVPQVQINNIWTKRLTYVAIMIAFPISVEYILQALKQILSGKCFMSDN